MPRNFVVSTTFEGHDRVSQMFRRMSNASDRFGRRAGRNFDLATRAASRFGDVVKGVLVAGVIQRGVSAAAIGVRSLTEEYLEFDKSVTMAAAKFPKAIDRGTAAFKRLGLAARGVGADTEFTAAQAGEGLNFLAMAGFNAAQATAALPGLTDLATVGYLDLGRASDIATDTLGAFGLVTDDSAQLGKNLTRVNDVMAKTITSSNVDLENMFETMKMAGPIAHGAGQSFETFAAATGIMGSAGIKGTLSGTALRTALIDLQTPTSRAANWMRKLKVGVTDASGNMRDFFDILKDVREGTKDMGTTQRDAALKAMFGKRAIAGMKVLLASSDEKLREFRTSLENAAGSSAKMAERIRKGLANRLQRLKSAATEVGLKFIDVFGKQIGPSIDRITESVGKLNVGQISADFRLFVEQGKQLLPVLHGVLGVFGAIKAVGLAASIKSLFAALGVVGLTAAIAATAVVGLGAAVGILIFNFKEITGEWELIFANLHLAALEFWEALKRGAVGASNFIIDIINRMRAALGSVLSALGINIPVGPLQKFRAETFANNRALEDQKQLIKEIKTELAGVGVQRGMVGRAHFASNKTVASDPSSVFDPVARELFALESGPQSRMAPQSSQGVDFKGQLDITGAPKGSTFKGTTKGAPPITSNLGAQ